MDFVTLPPEINSTRMYTGPGAGPLLTAAASWDALAGELRATAAAYEAAITRLTGESWLGPSSQAMAAAAARQVAWLTATAGAAEQTAGQVKSAAAAYQAAFAMTVPPAVVAANRAHLMILVATNLLGQNTAAIAATEAQYSEMWAQDVAAMSDYAAASAPATELTPFTPPTQTANPAAPAAAIVQAAGDSAGRGVQSVLSQLSLAAAPADAADVIEILDLLELDAVAVVGLVVAGGAWSTASTNEEHLIGLDDTLLAQQEQILGALARPQLGAALTAAGSGARPAAVVANLGEAVSAGKLSVPLSWATNAPQLRTLSYAAPLASGAAAPAVTLGSAGTAFSQMALAGMGGSALAGAVSRGPAENPQPLGTRTPAATVGADEPAENPVLGIAAELRQFGELRDAGLISTEEYNEQKQRLLGR